MTTLELSRRRLLTLAGGAFLAWQSRPWRLGPPTVEAQILPGDPIVVPTLEAFADTLIPGEKRSPLDRAIAGAASGPGAVQAGALELMNSPAAGVGPLLPVIAVAANARATAFAVQHGILLDPTVPPLVALDFPQRTALLVQLLDGTDPDQLLWFAVAALVFLAFHTAGHLDTAEAVAAGHPGLAAIGFPAPNADGRWRFPNASYRRPLAAKHPRSKRGSPS
jgi:enediyne biosynthesis protein E8